MVETHNYEVYLADDLWSYTRDGIYIPPAKLGYQLLNQWFDLFDPRSDWSYPSTWGVEFRETLQFGDIDLNVELKQDWDEECQFLLLDICNEFNLHFGSYWDAAHPLLMNFEIMQQNKAKLFPRLPSERERWPARTWLDTAESSAPSTGRCIWDRPGSS